MRQALAKAYEASFQRPIDPETEVVVTTGANEGMLSAVMAFVEPGDEVIVIEPFFDQYLSNIEMAGGVIRYVPMSPPSGGDQRVTSAGEWTIDFAVLEKTMNARTKIIVRTPPQPCRHR